MRWGMKSKWPPMVCGCRTALKPPNPSRRMDGPCDARLKIRRLGYRHILPAARWCGGGEYMCDASPIGWPSPANAVSQILPAALVFASRTHIPGRSFSDSLGLTCLLCCLSFSTSHHTCSDSRRPRTESTRRHGLWTGHEQWRHAGGRLPARIDPGGEEERVAAGHRDRGSTELGSGLGAGNGGQGRRGFVVYTYCM